MDNRNITENPHLKMGISLARKLKFCAVVFVLFYFVSFSYSCKKADSSLYEPPIDTTHIPKSDVAFWLTNADQTALLQKQNVSLVFGTTTNQLPSIIVDTN